MSGEFLEILFHAFHQKHHLGLHKHNFEIKTQRKNNLIDYPHPFLGDLKTAEYVHQSQENKAAVHYY